MKQALGFIAILILILPSCIDEIELDIDNDAQFVVIDASISDVGGLYTVSVKTSPILGVGNDNIFTPISGATVALVRGLCGICRWAEAGSYISARGAYAQW